MDGVAVRLAGSFGVLRAGRPPERPVAGKVRRLLALLAAERDRWVPMERIVEELWGVHPPRRPAENVATLVSRLRATLGRRVVEGGRDGYRLGAAPAVRVDLDEAARLVAEATGRLAEGVPSLAETAGTAALELLGGSGVLVGEPDADWVRRARAEGEALLRQARHATAAAACRVGDPTAARAVAEAAIADDRLDEVAYRLLMSAHQLAGEPARALACYQRLRAELVAELGADPDPRTRELHLAILREHAPPADPGPPPDPGPPADPGLPADGRGPTHRERVELVGRDAELARLVSSWSAACAHRPGLLLVVGEGGIGKTRLATELTAQVAAAGATVIHSRCYASERSLFLQPLVDALDGPLTAMPAARLRALVGSRAGALVRLLPRLDGVLGHPDTEHGTPEFELRRGFDAVVHVLRGLAAERPLLLVLDDLHNAGLATVELLHYLARRAGAERLLVLACVREEEGQQALAALAEVATHLDLGPLPAEAVARLAALAGQRELAGTILKRTRGHALFVVETLRALAAGDRGAPDSLQQVVLARLARAGPATEELLRAGAVLGATVDPAMAGAMVGLPPYLAAQRCAVAASARLLVVAGRSYEFANDLVQEVLYATTPEPLRVAHHRRAAELLAGAPELVAAHAVAAEEWSTAFEALLQAAGQAARRFATADAEQLAGRAVAVAERIGDRTSLARAHLARGGYRTVVSDFRPGFDDHRAALTAARAAGDRRLEMRALRELGGHTGIAVSLSEATAGLSDGLRIAEELGDHGMQARFLAWLAVLSSNRLRFADSLDHARMGVAAARRSGDEHALAAGLDGLKNAHAYLGDLVPLRSVLDELVPLLHRLGNLELLQWAVFESSFPAIGSADWDTAERRIAEAVAISERGGYDLHGAWFTGHLGWVARLRGRHRAAVEHGRRAVEATRRTPHRWFATCGDSQLAVTLLELGERDEARALLTVARDRAERDGAEAYLLRCLAPLAEVTGSAAVLEDADTLLARVHAPEGSAWLLGTDAYLAVARSWLNRGEPDRARAVLHPLLAAAERQGWVPAQAAGGLVDGAAAAALGQHDLARDLLCRAGQLATRHGMPTVARSAARALGSDVVRRRA
ncbi:MAG: ATP-binding protein [Pseudonocardia sp.]